MTETESFDLDETVVRYGEDSTEETTDNEDDETTDEPRSFERGYQA